MKNQDLEIESFESNLYSAAPMLIDNDMARTVASRRFSATMLCDSLINLIEMLLEV